MFKPVHGFVQALIVVTYMTVGANLPVGLAPTALAVTSGQPMLQPRTAAWLRLDGAAHNIRLNSAGTMLAFTDERGHDLSILDLRSRLTYRVTRHYVGPAFFWGPDGWRIFYRELFRDKNSQTRSQIAAYDAGQHRSVSLESFASVTGFPTYDPRELRLLMLTDKGITSKRLFLPDERLARWQIAQRYDNGKWLVTDKAVLWLTDGGLTLRKVSDDKQEIVSFDVSPDGQSIAWATQNQDIMTSHAGGPVARIARGLDPRWHPERNILAFASARTVGNKISGYELAIADEQGSIRLLTRSEVTQERWPSWEPSGNALVYTVHNSTDLFRLELTH